MSVVCIDLRHKAVPWLQKLGNVSQHMVFWGVLLFFLLWIVCWPVLVSPNVLVILKLLCCASASNHVDFYKHFTRVDVSDLLSSLFDHITASFSGERHWFVKSKGTTLNHLWGCFAFGRLATRVVKGAARSLPFAPLNQHALDGTESLYL